MVFSLTILAAKTMAQTKAEQKTNPQYGGTLRIISKYSPVNIGFPSQPSVPDDTTYNVPCVETLMHFDRQGKPIPWLATGWKVSKDLKTLTLALRKGVKFHDGTDFNAEAVKYLLDLFRASGRAELKAVSSVDIIDSYTIALTFSTQFQDHILSSLGGSAGMMVSATALKTHDKAWSMMNAIGTGCKMVKHERDSLLPSMKSSTDTGKKGNPISMP